MRGNGLGVEPARHVMANPYAMLHSDVGAGEDTNLIDDPVSVDACNLFGGCYELIMQLMGRLLHHSGESEEQLAKLSDVTVAIMMVVISPLGVALTKMPTGPSHPGLNAGPSFRASREMQSAPHQTAAWGYFSERLKELSTYCDFLHAPAELAPLLGKVPESSAQYVEHLDADSWLPFQLGQENPPVYAEALHVAHCQHGGGPGSLSRKGHFTEPVPGA